MGRWTQYDEDDYRLPEGMKRVGYDADTQRYTYKDQQGATWIGPEGSQYGDDHEELVVDGTNEVDLEASAPSRGDGYQPMATEDVSEPDGSAPPRLRLNASPYRALLPFFLIVLAFLLLVIRLVSPPSLEEKVPPMCPEGSHRYGVKSGDSCWAISQEYGTSVESLRRANPDLDCNALRPEQWLCVPAVVSSNL
ncbi:hypothetical protein BD410DRAFT_713127 [Rickenella mellea]|uniref:LysM domain-containing protein n=1 Tax=Rickenella mellea TaxID=50990 RepID=A0A4Y7QME1_9AGAM|nr:hypothetical protein BD410DRAFT_713127 [Rickenella mellea]